MRLKKHLMLSALLGLCALAQADVKVPSVFSDHMVLQRDRKVVIFGTGTPGENVEVSIADAKAQATTDDKGKWKVDIGPLTAGGPFDLTLAGNNTVTIKDVLVGEVWLCSGQSNMEMPLGPNGSWGGGVIDWQKEVAGLNDPQLRMYYAEHTTNLSPQENVKGFWQQCNPQEGRNFSAVGYYFARKLREELKCPVGMVHISWGGTPVEAWTSYQKLATIDSQKRVIAALDVAKAAPPVDPAKLRAWQEQFAAITTAATGRTFTNPESIGAPWKSVHMPQPFEKVGLENVDGVVWFQKSIDLPAELVGQDVQLSLGSIDDHDTTYVNGVCVGQTSGFSTKRMYAVGHDLTKNAKLTIDVRVYDAAGKGGLSESAPDLWIGNGAKKMPLDGDWQMKLDAATAALGDRPVDPMDKLQGKNTATGLFNAMLNPAIPYTIRGAIWYQGESNAGQHKLYRELFSAMITDWRERFGQPELPFYFVQLSSWNPGAGNWPFLREAQTQTLSLPNTAMAVTIDVGHPTDIHPKNKRAVGERLALPALAMVYGQKIEYSGPMYQSMKIERDAIRLTFAHLGKGLSARGDEALSDFLIAGEDQKFVPATATIDGNSIVVKSADIKAPQAVRYAWSDNAPKANLINREGLPASPFRTDNWFK